MISAETARKQTERAHQEILENELRDIEQLILSAVEKGHYYIQVDYLISSAAQEELNKLGYETTYNIQLNEPGITISWEKTSHEDSAEPTMY